MGTVAGRLVVGVGVGRDGCLFSDFVCGAADGVDVVGGQGHAQGGPYPIL